MHDGNILGLLAQATIVVQVVIGLLILMSLMSWTLIFQKWHLLNQAKKKSGEALRSLSGARDLQSAVQALSRDTSAPGYEIAAQGVKELNRLAEFNHDPRDKGKVIMENVDRALDFGVSRVTKRLTASLAFLATCANSAPFIGLFGTVWGIMNSFQAIGKMQTASLAAVAPGISEALVATAIGLAVAIPATIAFNTFLSMTQGIETELRDFASLFINRVQRELPQLMAEYENGGA